MSKGKVKRNYSYFRRLNIVAKRRGKKPSDLKVADTKISARGRGSVAQTDSWSSVFDLLVNNIRY